MTEFQDITGSGGSKKQRTPVEQEVTFSSKAIAFVAIAYSEGECGGLTDAGRSIYIDQTPLIADDGSTNFPGVTWEQRYGLPDQEPVPDFTWAASLKEVNTQLFATAPYIRTVSSPEVDKISIIIRTPAMQEVKDNGDQVGTELAFKVEKYDPVAQVWSTEHERFSFKGRVVSNYEVEIPVGRAGPENTDKPWQIRVTRLTPDSTTNRLINESHISYIVERVAPEGDIVRYNNTAYIAVRIDTSLFGDRLPVVSFRVNGIKVRVPDNYNPVTRQYSGVWSGNFKWAVTSNPAWQIYDLLLDTRYGLGLAEGYVNKFELYTMARYCDGLVPDGLGGQRPRFTCRTQIQDSEDAISLLNAIASSMRAAPYWGAGSVNVVQDAPKDPVKIASQVNVIDGAFNWRGTELANRYTTCYVSWNDPVDFFRPRIAKYQDDAAVAKYGLNETSLAKFGCANEAEAIAFAKYVVDSSLHETQVVSFTGGMEFADARPGDVIQVADPMRAKSRMSGRVRANGTTPTRLVLDAPVVLAPGQTYSLIYVTGNEDNYIITAPLRNGAGTHAAVDIGTDANGKQIEIPFEVDHPYVIAGSDIVPKTMRITSVKEDDGKYPIVANEFDVTKFSRTELGIQIEPPVTSRYTDKSIRPPSNARIRDEEVVRDGVHHRVVTLAWDASPTETAVGYIVQWRRENLNYSPQITTGLREFELVDPRVGTYDFLVSAVSGLGGAESTAIQVTYVVGRAVPLVIPLISGLRLKNAVDPAGTQFRVPDAEFTWNHASTAAGEFGSDPAKASLDDVFMDYQVDVFDEDFRLLRSDSTVENWYIYSWSMNLADRKAQGFSTPTRRFTIEVRQRGKQGQVSDTPARLSVSNPAPPVPAGLDVQPFFRFYRVQHDVLTGPDEIGTIVWASTTKGFTPDASNRVYTGVGFIHDVEAKSGTEYFVRAAVYDTFGEFDLNISDERKITTFTTEVSFADPKLPTGLALSTTSEILADGSQRVRVIATWDKPVANADTTWWDIGITEATGSEIVFPVAIGDPAATPRYEFDARLNTVYSIRIRSVNVVTFSGWTAAKTITSGKDNTIPPAPSTLKGAAAFKTVFLSWVNPDIDDLDYIEVHEGTTTIRAGGAGGVGAATVIARVYTDSYTRSGLNTGDTRYYWVRAVDTSGNVSDFYPATTGIAVTTSKIVGGPDIEANSITTNLLTAGEIRGDVIKTGTLDAGALKSDSVLAGTIKVGTNTLTDLSSWAANPALRINLPANTTLIDPGKILISGASTLASWRGGSDLTTINGGKIEANSIKANSIQIGDRAVEMSVQFEHNGVNGVSWSSGTVSYVDDDGSRKTRTIEAGGFTRVGPGLMYIGWPRTQTLRPAPQAMQLFTSEVNPATSMPSNNWVIVATYAGGSLLVVNYGKTLISGSDIKTGTVTAANIQALSITAGQIATNTITGDRLAFATITGDRISGGTITGGHIAGNTITGGHITGNTISGGHITANTIGVGHLTAGTLSATNIESGAITAGKLITVGDNIYIDARTHEGFKGRIFINYPNGRNVLWMGSFGKNSSGVDEYGLQLNHPDGRQIFRTTTGLDGTFIQNLTVDTISIKSNAVTVPSVERMVPGDVQGNLANVSDGGPADPNLAQILRSDIYLNQPGTIVAWANLAQKYPSGTRSYRIELWVDGVFRAERHAGTGAYNDSPSIMIMVKNLGIGPHSVILKWGAQSGCYRSDAVLCVMGAMR